jgi:hypothetical protein
MESLRSTRRATGSIPFLFSLIFVFALAGWSQRKSVKLSKVYIGQDGLAHVVTQGGEDIAISKADGQVGVMDPRLASNDRTAGWLIEQDNCCTSYPIPTRIGVYRDGKTTLINLILASWFTRGNSWTAGCKLLRPSELYTEWRFEILFSSIRGLGMNLRNGAGLQIRRLPSGPKSSTYNDSRIWGITLRRCA